MALKIDPIVVPARQPVNRERVPNVVDPWPAPTAPRLEPKPPKQLAQNDPDTRNKAVRVARCLHEKGRARCRDRRASTQICPKMSSQAGIERNPSRTALAVLDEEGTATKIDIFE